ncbi:glycosyl hydrolase [Phenylobacterium sp.]|uniref:glycosyl hydrolase n=1 Tax=Phenylobacterium sp. TaxID=1871053 RepID=UPI0025D65849|nr:glycosyl hydrolase [Phenylobacterium sp.]
MTRRSLIASGAALALTPAAAGAAPGAGDLLAGFRAPPQAARPRTWWHWLAGNVTAEGARLDLEWMRRVGLGGVHTFSGQLIGEPALADPRAPFMSPVWRKVFRDSAEFAHGAGMEVGIAGSPGWSQTGGIFVEPQDGMKKYVWSVTEIEGGTTISGPLRAPPRATGPFQGMAKASRARQLKGDVYSEAFVVAFPTPASEEGASVPEYVADSGPFDLTPLAAGDLSASVKLPIRAPAKSAWIEARYAAPTRVMALTVGLKDGAAVEVLASDDGVTFRKVAEEVVIATSGVDHPAPQQTLSFEAVTARVFRVVLTELAPPPPLPGLPPGFGRPRPPLKAFDIAAFGLERSGRVHRFEAKAGFDTTIGAAGSTPAVAKDALVRRADVIDLTAKLGADGTLDWTPPPGRWTVLRFGWSLTGASNGPAEPEATGLEVDKLDAAAVRRYADAYLGLYDEATGSKVGANAVTTLLTDSWEAGFQNWTPALFDEFRRRRGYEPTPYAPVLAGRVVDSAETSDRFLWDLRLTLKELLADAHYGTLAKALHQRGMTYYTEASGDNPRILGDGMAIKGRSDIPTAEYWYRDFASGPGQLSLKADLEEAASAAHVYGKRLVAAESLTVAAGPDPWAFSPRMLKPVADEIFARGINRIIIHDSRQQPLVDAKPGMTLAIFGQYFNRNETWAEDAGPWVDYLARTSHLLQQGDYVADVAYYYGENRNLSELFRRRLNTDVPVGHRYDYVNREALLDLLSVRGGRIVTPSGMSYRVLYLPDHVTRHTEPALRKIGALIRAGAVVVGPRPVGGLGLTAADEAIEGLAGEIWGAEPLAASGRKVGRGRLFATLADAFAGEGVAPDFSFAGAGDSELLALHRRTPEADIYFVTNQKDRAAEVSAAFRVTGRAPEIWRAADGSTEPLSYSMEGGRTKVALKLEPHEALFVVFRKATRQAGWQAPDRKVSVAATIEAPWSVSFGPGLAAPAPTTFGALTSWAESSDPRIRYYSGSATYRSSVTVEGLARGERWLLDLGRVHELAVVEVNGRPVGTAWHAPYRLDVTDALKAGRNEIAVRVVNLWPNRLIGDKQPGAKPVTFAPMSTYTAQSPLLPSGLLGPVRLLVSRDALK